MSNPINICMFCNEMYKDSHSCVGLTVDLINQVKKLQANLNVALEALEYFATNCELNDKNLYKAMDAISVIRGEV